MFDLRVIDVDESLLGLEVSDESDGGRLASVTSVSFECESKNGNTLLKKKKKKHIS